jgi:hypothetical protein
MIYVDRTITVQQGASRIDEPVILYRGDYEVSVRFTIVNQSVKFGSEFNMIDYENTPNAQLIILSPTKEAIFSDILRCEEGVATFTIPQELVDELQEVGKYSFQIRLYDYDQSSRITIPQVKNGIIVREPITTENN